MLWHDLWLSNFIGSDHWIMIDICSYYLHDEMMNCTNMARDKLIICNTEVKDAPRLFIHSVFPSMRCKSSIRLLVW